MGRNNPRFEQVPLEVVKRIVEEQAKQHNVPSRGKNNKMKDKIETPERRTPLLEGERRDWRESFRTLTPEPTADELWSRLVEVEGAIFIRLQQLADSGDAASNEERNEIDNAMRTIRRLQIEKLSYPEFNPANGASLER